MTDTDCLWINTSLPSKFVGKEIGLFKHEFSAEVAIFPAPKLYYAIDKNGKEIRKGKGVKPGSLQRIDYENLAKGIPVYIEENRFVKDFKNQSISVHIHKAKLTCVHNKRNPIYKNGIVVDTKPLIVKDGVISYNPNPNSNNKT